MFPRRQQLWAQAGGGRAYGPGWLTRSPLPHQCRTETEAVISYFPPSDFSLCLLSLFVSSLSFSLSLECVSQSCFSPLSLPCLSYFLSPFSSLIYPLPISYLSVLISYLSIFYHLSLHFSTSLLLFSLHFSASPFSLVLS